MTVGIRKGCIVSGGCAGDFSSNVGENTLLSCCVPLGELTFSLLRLFIREANEVMNIELNGLVMHKRASSTQSTEN